jgi:hypothetical protein
MNERKLAKKSLASKIVSIFFGALIVVMLAFEGYGLISARSNYGVPNFFGYQFLVIQTDSMDTGPDTFPVDMGIIVQKVDPDTLVASTAFEAFDGDVITFFRRSDGRVVTHRIVDIETNSAGLVFVCIGDNLNAETCPPAGCSLSSVDRVPEVDVLGKVVNKSKAIGTAYRFLANPLSMLLLVMVPLGALVVLSAIDFVKAVKTKQPAEVTNAPLLSQEDIEAIKNEAKQAILEQMKKQAKEEENNE